MIDTSYFCNGFSHHFSLKSNIFSFTGCIRLTIQSVPPALQFSKLPAALALLHNHRKFPKNIIDSHTSDNRDRILSKHTDNKWHFWNCHQTFIIHKTGRTLKNNILCHTRKNFNIRKLRQTDFLPVPLFLFSVRRQFLHCNIQRKP